ncbi:MAG: hypothetical protein IH932_04155 [Thaumarchaeota archaeon]|nr:hypothetical protein [Nitrososphaerota archaeon]
MPEKKEEEKLNDSIFNSRQARYTKNPRKKQFWEVEMEKYKRVQEDLAKKKAS